MITLYLYITEYHRHSPEDRPYIIAGGIIFDLLILGCLIAPAPQL